MDRFSPLPPPFLCSLSLKASENYLSLYHTTNPTLLAQSGGVTGSVKGDVFVHPSAKVSPTAKVCIILGVFFSFPSLLHTR